MRPSGVTAVASVNTRPAPPAARAPRWTRCQSLAKPSMLEYWHIGETAMRFGRVTSRNEIGENKGVMPIRFADASFDSCKPSRGQPRLISPSEDAETDAKKDDKTSRRR